MTSYFQDDGNDVSSRARCIWRRCLAVCATDPIYTCTCFIIIK